MRLPSDVMLALGVDVSVARGLDLVLLDARRRLVGAPLRRQTAEDLRRVLVERRPDIVAIDSPPKFGINGGSRRGERELLALGVHLYFTPSDPEKSKKKFYDWMRAGFAAFKAAAQAGYPLFTGGGNARGHALEVFPHASAVALKGSRPPNGTCKNQGMKRRWRAAVLEDNGIGANSDRRMRLMPRSRDSRACSHSKETAGMSVNQTRASSS